MDLKKIRLAGIIEESVVDGEGIRFVIFTQGCLHNCLNCHNKETHDLNGGKLYDCDELIDMINQTKYLNGVTFSGGEPFLQAKMCAYIASKIKKEYDIYAYTGYVYEDLINKNDEDINEFLKYIDVLIDGPFINSLKSLELRFRGSSNQRIIDVKKSLNSNKTVIKENLV